VTIRREWMGMLPQRAWQLGFWGEVAKRVRREHVSHRNTPAIFSIVKEIDYEFRATSKRRGK
jgi:hypothetical protein